MFVSKFVDERLGVQSEKKVKTKQNDIPTM